MKKCMMLFVMVMSFVALIFAGSPQASEQCPRVAGCPRVAACPRVCPGDSTVRCPRVADCPQVCPRQGKRCQKVGTPCGRPRYQRGCRR